MKKSISPIVKKIIDKFDSVYDMTKLFAENEKESAVKGLLISGDAGMGKTHFVQKAIVDAGRNERTQIVKGSSISAPALYVVLYMYRHKDCIVVLDDVDIVHKEKSEKNQILDMLKGATEITKNERTLQWLRASSNSLMRDNNVPTSFNFEGSIIWITNDTIEDIQKQAKNHWNAINSRFSTVRVNLNKEEKLLYTQYLIEEIGMLGKNCEGKEGGYSLKIQNLTLEYLNDNYDVLPEVTPRMAIRIADTIMNFPTKWEQQLSNQF